MPRPSMVSGATGAPGEETAAPGLLKGRKRIAARAIATNVRLGGIRGRILQRTGKERLCRGLFPDHFLRQCGERAFGVVVPSAAQALGLEMVTYGLKAVPFCAVSFELSF